MVIPLPQPLLWDGATGTQLQKRGMPADVCTEQWILAHPEELLAVQRAYVEAGAQVLLAPTLGASPAALERFGLGAQAAVFNRRLVALSREAADGRALVAGDIAPCNLSQTPVRDAQFEALVENYKVQVAALKEAGVDLYLVETMVSMAEARAAVLAVKETDPERAVLVSFYCDDEGRTPDGTDVLAALIVLQGMGVDGFGLNCAPEGDIAAQLARLSVYATVPLLAMPSGGARDTLDAWVQTCADLGVRHFGGCCHTDEGYIAALKSALEGLNLPPFTPKERDPDVIPCASEKEARFITPDVDVGQPIQCTSDLLEDILEAEEQSPQGALKIAILDELDLALFAENQYAVRDALCLWSDVPELLEQALRTYQGRAFWDGTGDLEREFLANMSRVYGLILL